MSPAAVRISSAIAPAAPISVKPTITATVDSICVASAVKRAAEGGEHEAERHHRLASDPVHRPAGGERGQRRGGQEDRGAEPEQPLDAGDEHERERRHRRDELHDGRERPPSSRPAAIVLRLIGSDSTVTQAIEPVRPESAEPRRATDGGHRRRRALRARGGRPARSGGRGRAAAGRGVRTRSRRAWAAGSSSGSPGTCGCVGTRFQSRTSSESAELLQDGWTMVALDLGRARHRSAGVRS